MYDNLNMIEYLLLKNKNMILSSKLQNTLYNGKPLYEYFGEKQRSKKEGESFEYLMMKLVEDLPPIDYEKLKTNYNLYMSNKNIFFKCNGKIVKANDLHNHIKRYADDDEIPINYDSPSFFSRSFKVLMYNKKTKETHIKPYTMDKKKEFYEDFGYLLSTDYKQLEKVFYNEYKNSGYF